MRKHLLGLLAALSFLAPSVAAAQVCPAVAALPDSERRVAYAPSASTGPFSVTFAVLGDGTDYGAWVEVWLNGVMLTPVTQWQLTIPAGTLATACRPITNASIVLTSPATGTLQIVGARRPRRTSQLPENQGVSAHNLNQVITDITATNRETWDKTNDVTGRAVIGRPGETLSPLPSAASRAGKFLTFDGSGNPVAASPSPGLGNVLGPVSSGVGNLAVWGNTSGTLLADGGLGVRTRLSANRTYFVNPSGISTAPCGAFTCAAGSDSNTGLTISDPFLTPQKAWDVISQGLDLSGFTVTVQLSDGTYSSTSSIITGCEGPPGVASAVSIVFQGNSATPNNVAFTSSSAGGVINFGTAVSCQATMWLKNFKISASAGSGISAFGSGSSIIVSAVNCDTVNGACRYAAHGGQITELDNYAIAGTNGFRVRVESGGLLIEEGRTITYTSTPVFLIANVYVDSGKLYAAGMTHTGAATGTRFTLKDLGYINTGTTSLTYFPGNVAGTITTGSIYNVFGARTRYTAATTFYVRADGNNSNDCLSNSAGGACLTLQGAWNLFANSYDTAGFDTTIQVVNTASPTTFAGGLSINQWVGGGNVLVQGDTGNMDNVVLSAATAISVGGTFTGKVTIQYFKFTGSVLHIDMLSGAGYIQYGNLDFTGSSVYNIRVAQPGGRVEAIGPFTVANSLFAHVHVEAGMWNTSGTFTATISGTPAWGVAFIDCVNRAMCGPTGLSGAVGVTYSGAATGKKFNAGAFSLIQANGSGVEYFPGTAGSCSPKTLCLSGGDYQ